MLSEGQNNHKEASTFLNYFFGGRLNNYSETVVCVYYGSSE